MFQDICFPNGNEREFADTALKLGTKALIFVYEFKDFKTFEAQKKELEKIKELKTDIGVFVDEKSVNKVSQVDAYVFARTATKSMIEQKKTHILYDFELQDKYDFMHHRNSGLNQVLCKMMKEKDKVLAISFSTLLNARSFGVVLGRMQQNIRLAKKYKVNIVVASFAKTPYELRAEHELKSFEKILGV